MDITELLNSSLGQSIIQNVASQFGMDQKEASGAVSAAIPTILAGMTKNAQSKEGAESLNRAIESKHDGSLLDNLSGILQGHTQELQQDGDGILGHVFGNKRSAVEQGISNKTGVSSSKIGPLLSTLAPIVMAYLGKEKRQTSTNAGGLGDLLGGLMGGAKQSRSGGGIMDLISGALDKDGDGDAMDDILDMFSKKR
ncbi:MAG: DUF937 domain-containing protein [Fermentimonas sp.]|jgi:hypothetical protein|nr:DUF937 domain-containing protein [Fermentimonas sp.]NLC86096.1 DUF937 domain-containing protein [Bacteroidales bacterium]MDD2930959.1 DUF937 domain-containing protein [Fermentimonas sp.]MDD3188348.1 DUF937 domain-containing protein [Fermentimonas sp.]MDD3510969.1 DUF937 domain-containing protein [Fermentimonas sp.]